MQRFWWYIAVELGKRAGLVSVIGLLVTLILGFGITRLDFSTGQDSYLNKSDAVYKVNVTVALLSALVFLPPMLVWADRRNWVSRGLVSREILERTAAQPRPEPVPAPS